MGSLVIVAIPAEDELVWQVSSEKVPHMTLVYLGDSADVDPDEYQKIVDFVEHAATLLNPFWMDVDYRGTLGPDDADVYFFEKGWDFKSIAQFRDQLMQNSTIKRVYNSVANQFTQWLPHLTLGYPATPAKTPERDRSVFSIRFDRIAVWTDNYDGPEFRLKRDPVCMDEDSLYVSMSMNEARSLLHYGVKGMKWGVRRERMSGDRALFPTPGGAKAQLQKFIAGRNKAAGPPSPVVAKTSISKKTGKASIDTTGGERQPAHPDAVKAAVASKQLHTSGIKSLSNKDLQDLATRIDLEQRVSRLDPAKTSKGKAFVNNKLNNPNKTASEIDGYKKLADEGHKLVKLALVKHAVKVATAGAV